jgi:sulfur carrier protein
VGLPSFMPKITANGEPVELDPGSTVEDLITSLGLSGAICAAEVNREVVPRSERPARELAEGDTVEIVTLVGGG